MSIGIHGRPYLPWDDVQGAPGAPNNGYCNHISILFPTWHRPYLALYEVWNLILNWQQTILSVSQQVLYDHIQFIASLYEVGPTRNRYVTAAQKFRIPYWDWAAVPEEGQSTFPISIGGSPTMTVAGPSGAQVISNPLFSYTFQPLKTAELPDWPVSILHSARTDVDELHWKT